MAIESSRIHGVIPYNLQYAIGSIVPDAEFDRLDCEQQIAALRLHEREIGQHIEERHAYNEAVKQLSTSSSSLEQSNETLELHPGKSLSLPDLRYEQNAVFGKYEKLKEESKRLRKLIESNKLRKKMLPIDHDKSHLQYKLHYNDSEILDSITLKKDSAQSELDAFVESLSKRRYPSILVDLISQISASILRCVQQQDQEVCLLASSITLAKVRIFDPIVLRKDIELSEIFKDQDVFNCSVVTGTILGGAFVGFGAITNYHSVNDRPQEVSASVKVFSYIAQGAIPITPTANLWAAYMSWKEQLTSESRLHSGFPVALQTRSLSDILRENQILTPR